jgi:iron complex outermembrane recepter protein
VPVGERASECLSIGKTMNHLKKLPDQHQLIKHACALAFGLVVTSPVLAQSKLETVVVSGSRFEENIERTPANIQVITKEQIQQSTSTNVAEALAQIGNVQITNNSGSTLGIGATPDLGGYGASASSNTLILVDGIRLNPIDSSSAPLNTIPLSSIERIEIVNGGASVQFGNNATGGVINIITKNGAQQASSVGITYGSYGTIIGDVSLRKKEGNTTVLLSGNSSETNGWRTQSQALSNSFLGRISQDLGGADKVFIDGTANHWQGKIPQIIVGEVGTGDVNAINPANVGNNYLQDGSGIRGGIVKSLSQNALFEMEAAYGSSSAISVNQGSQTNYDKSSVNLTPRVKLNWGRWGSSVIGYDYNKSDGSNTNYSSFYAPSYPASHVNLKNQSIYFMERLPLTDQVELAGGIRRQKQDVSFISLNNSDLNGNGIADGTYPTTFAANAYDFGINYRYATGQRLYGKYDQSFRFANTDEYFGYNPLTNQNFTTGAILRPQINKTFEIGNDFTFGQTKANISIYQTNSHDEIRLVNDPNGGGGFGAQTNVNDDDIRRTGLNLNGTTALTSALNVGAGFRYQRAVYTSGINSGYLVSLVPQYLLNLSARYQATHQIAFGGVANYVASQYYDGDTQNAYNPIPSYVTGDVFAEYKIKGLEARFMIKNVSNANYAVYGSNQAVYGSSPYNYLPAPPRMFFGSIKYNFDL